MCVQHIPSPLAAAKTKISHTYSGPLDDAVGDAMLSCDQEVRLTVIVSMVICFHGDVMTIAPYRVV